MRWIKLGRGWVNLDHVAAVDQEWSQAGEEYQFTFRIAGSDPGATVLFATGSSVDAGDIRSALDSMSLNLREQAR